MTGGKDCEGGDVEGQAVPVQVPIGWRRKVDPSGVIYISPSGSVLSSLDQVRTYLLTDGTCKCGLECPLILPKVFNFDLGAAVKQRTAEDVRADEDVTKLCIHKRKLLAVATLHQSATAMAPTHSTQRAIRNTSHEALPNSVVPDCKNPFKMMMTVGQQRHYPQELSGPQQQELYAGYPRQHRLGSSDPGPRSPYRTPYGGMLSPPSSSSQLYGDGPLSPRTDPLGSPDVFPRNNACGFPGANSPSSIHGGNRTPLSPPGMLLHGSPAAQSSCAMAGRTSTPLSPSVTAKSPVMKKPLCNFPSCMDIPRAAFHHKAQPASHSAPPPAIPPPCTLQKKQMTSEKDPLGILDPIPSKPLSQASANSNPSNFQSSVPSQVPMMNVNVPPAIVPLPSNLPLPTVKPGPVAHGGHLQRTVAAPSMSPSPVTSPVHMAGPALGRMEASPQRSRSSSTSSDHGSFAMPSGPQGPCGTMKVPPRSPRSSMGSPRPTMPSSPSAKPDSLHQYKDMPSQLLVGMSNAISAQHNPMYPPTSGTSAPQKGHPGLLGMPLNQMLNQQNAASFPASSLLSAAAKAQLANQNKLNGGSSGGSNAGMGSSMGSVGTGSGSGHPGALSGTRNVVEGHSTLNPMLPPNSTMLLTMTEGQSGRAALRDKLMAQQRDPLRKRKQPTSGGHDRMVFSMLKPNMGSPRPPGPAEQLRKVARMGGLPPNTSMAQLLQSMSCQSSHMAGNNRPVPTGSGQMHYNDGAMGPGASQQSLLAQQRLHGQGEGMHCQGMDSRGHGPHGQFPGMMSQMQASSLGNCGPLGPTGQVGPGNLPLGHPNTNPPPLSHPSQHPPQHNHLHTYGRTGMSALVHNSNDGSCGQAVSESGDTSSLNCSMNNPQLDNLQPHIINSSSSSSSSSSGQVFQQQHAQQQQLHQGMQAMQGLPGFQGLQPFPENPFPDNNSSNPMACLYQNFQGCLPETASVHHAQMTTQSGMTSLPEAQGMLSHPQFGEAQQEMQTQGEGMPGSDRLPGGGAESVDAIYRAVVDAASKGMHVVITTTVSGTTQASPVPALSAMSAFTSSIGEPVNLPHAVNSVIHGHRGHQEGDSLTQQQQPQQQPQPPRTRQARPGRPRKNSEQGKSTPEGGESHDYFRSPGCGTPRAQWEGEAHTGLDGHATWGGEEFLECSTHVRSSPCMERPGSLAPAPPCPADSPHEHGLPLAADKAFLEDGFRFNSCNRAATVNYKDRLEQTVERCAHINGGGPLFSMRGYGDVLGPPRQELTGDDQSPSSSTSLEGSLPKEYVHYNGHFNGCAPSPSDTKSLSSEEDLRHPDSPSSELLHYRSGRTFNMGDLVWGQLKGFPSWPGKLVGEEQVHSAAMQLREQGKMEPENLKTLSHDLEALDRASKRNRKAGKLNNHLEAAIHEAMSELDKMSGTVHQIPSRDRQVKLPKPKRRKISR